MSFAEKSASIFKRDLFLKAWGIIMGIIIARILGSVNMGLWYILLMIPSYAEPFGRLKLDVASVYFIGRRKYRLGEVYFNLIMLSLLSSAAIILIFFWQREFIFLKLLKGALVKEYLVYLMFACIPFSFITINYSYLFLAKEDIRSYNRITIIGPIVSSVLALFFLIILKWGLLSLVICQLISGCIGVLYGAWKLGKTDKIISHLNIKMLKDLFNFGSKLYLVGIVGYLQIYVTVMIVALFLNSSAVTFFKMGQEKALLLIAVPGAISTILYPVVAKDNDSSGYIAVKACRISTLLLTIVAVLGAIIIKPAVYLLYGKEFLPQIGPFWILLPGIVFLGIGNVLLQYFTGKGNPELVLKISIVPLFLQIGMSVILMPSFGILGAALATSLTYLLTGIITMMVFVKSTNSKIYDLIVPKRGDFVLLNNFIAKQCQRTSG